jgi:hypothetical protein
MKGPRILPSHQNEQGAIFIIVAVFVLLAGLGLAAFAITFSRLHVIQNEIHNAADAGAMAGAGDLLNVDGTINDPDYHTTADQTAKANSSGGDPVEVVSIKRGHWSFATHQFTENNDPQLDDLFSYNFHDLDTDTRFINAVEVVTQRTSIPSFFARILGHSSFERTARAVAYIAPPGSFEEYEVEQPIAICLQAITNDDGNLECVTGRFINSSGTATTNTGAWTNFQQPDPCTGAANANQLKALVCSGGNPTPIVGKDVQLTNGEVQSAFSLLDECWRNEAMYDSDGDGNSDHLLDTDDDDIPDQIWSTTLLVIDCPGYDTAGPVGEECEKVLGVVSIDILWIQEDNTNQSTGVPEKMGDWVPGVEGYPVCDYKEEACREALWASFVSHFGLLDVTNNPAPFIKKALYFRPACEWAEPTGGPGGGGGFFGVLSDRPVLVH